MVKSGGISAFTRHITADGGRGSWRMATPPLRILVRPNSARGCTKFHFVQDWVSREDHRCQRGHFDHLFDVSDPSKGLGLE